jgi:hypothetical protein
LPGSGLEYGVHQQLQVNGVAPQFVAPEGIVSEELK